MTASWQSISELPPHLVRDLSKWLRSTGGRIARHSTTQHSTAIISSKQRFCICVAQAAVVCILVCSCYTDQRKVRS